MRRGAYVLYDTPATGDPARSGSPDIILMASGSEVGLIVAAEEKLAGQRVRARLVSVPSWELFDAQPPEYRDAVLPPAVKARIAVEAGAPQGWCRYTGDAGAVIGVERFGASAPGAKVMQEYGFTVDNVVTQALKLLGR